MWTAWLRALEPADGEVVLTEPAGDDALADAEDRLELILPEDLRSLLAETDGVSVSSGGEPVWPVERIAEENALLRSAGATPALPEGADEDLLFFGEAGGGDLFVYELDDDGDDISEPDIYLWQAAVGEARWIASDLQSLLDIWFAGTLDR